MNSRLRSALAAGSFVAVVGWVAAVHLGDDIWFLNPFLFGPRWPAYAAVLGVVPYMLHRPVRGMVLGVFLLLSITFLGMGAVVSLAGLSASTNRASIHVLTFNLQGNTVDGVDRLLRWTGDRSVDIMVLTECAETDAARLQQSLRGHIEHHMDLCLWSRWPIREWHPRAPRDIWQFSGWGAIAWARLDSEGSALKLGLVHLETARDGLSAFFDLFPLSATAAQVRDASQTRQVEAGLAWRWIMENDGPEATIIAGDFNTPVESGIYRRVWSPLRNAWHQAGLGFGYTWYSRWHGARIDHVLHSDHWTATRAEVGPWLGSDHRPVLIELHRVGM